MPASDLRDTLSRHVKLRELRVLLAVAEQGSLRKAGQLLHVTQPAITATIAELESTLGVRLFDRTAHGVTPTVHGESFIRRARAIFGELDLASEEIERISSGSSGMLRVGAVPTHAAGILPRALTRLLDSTPNVFVDVADASYEELVALLKARQIELFFSRLREPGADPDLRYQKLFDDSVCVVASCRHPLAARKRVAWPDVCDEKWVLPPPGVPFFDQIQRTLHRRGFAMPRHTIQTFSFTVMYSMVGLGNFLSFGLRVQHDFTALQPTLAAVNVDLPKINAAFGVITLRHREPSPLGQQLVRIVAGLAQDSRRRHAPYVSEMLPGPRSGTDDRTEPVLRRANAGRS